MRDTEPQVSPSQRWARQNDRLFPRETLAGGSRAGAQLTPHL